MDSHPHVRVEGQHVRRTSNTIEADFHYRSATIETDQYGNTIASPFDKTYTFRTNTNVPRAGVMLVGWGGNNGATVTGATIANRSSITWNTKRGLQKPNYYGSLLLASTLRMGFDRKGKDVYAPLNSVLPMLHPDDLVFGGWDINDANLADAMARAQVFEYDLQKQLVPHMTSLKPLPSIYYPDYIAANQEERANNLIPGTDKMKHLQAIREDIANFKRENNLDTVIILWTATTERCSSIIPGVNDTASNLIKSIEASHSEVSPSTIFAVASILEGCPYINGSPQNTFVPGCIELAEMKNVFIGGDDFKSGQTKFKSVMVDFLVGAGLKPTSIASYNHLGNNDGRNLSAPNQFRSKEISKSNVVDDMVRSNPILYKPGETPDHVVVIKYIPSVADSKRAMDEYTSEIFMGGTNTIVTHNTCEDSLLAAPLIFDLVILCELFCRIQYKSAEMASFEHFHPVLSVLSYMLKAPLVPKGTPVVNALFKQRACIENLLRICAGLPPENDLRLEHRTSDFFNAANKTCDSDISLGNGTSHVNGAGHANGIANGGDTSLSNGSLHGNGSSMSNGKY